MQWKTVTDHVALALVINSPVQGDVALQMVSEITVLCINGFVLTPLSEEDLGQLL